MTVQNLCHKAAPHQSHFCCTIHDIAQYYNIVQYHELCNKSVIDVGPPYDTNFAPSLRFLRNHKQELRSYLYEYL